MPRRAPAPDLDAALTDALATGRKPATPTSSFDPALDATSELLARNGLRHWTVDDVAHQSGTARATLYRRYGSRDGLVQAAVTREVRRFFAAIATIATSPALTSPAGPSTSATPPTRATEVEASPTLTDIVVDGLLAGLRLARRSPLGDMIRRDPATAMGLLSSPTLLAAATTALSDLYLAMPVDPAAQRSRHRTETRAEALVRLAISFLLVPGSIDDQDDMTARLRLHDMVAPLIESPRFQPAERLLQNCP